ncbi:hypothetical protein F4778DRAFT_695801 [Xylariomycetidae sp. FL2044]|nr:hypothetical protein F4778DRAFT_695801 [Xylariomycetidae sp. FL2044]
MKSFTLAAATLFSILSTPALGAPAVPADDLLKIAVERLNGAATGQGAYNETITVALNEVYADAEALRQISTLYLVGMTKMAPTAWDAVVCTPYKSAEGKGEHGVTFSSKKPARLDLNRVDIGSIVCEEGMTSDV